MKNSFFLVIPQQRNQPQRLKEFEAKTLQHWLDELPAANLGLATRLIHDFIIELNTLSMPGQFRIDVLERINSKIILIEDYLQKRLLKTGFPKDNNEKKIFEVLISIEKECGIGYWAALKEFTHRDAGWFKGKSTALSIQRCIKILGRIIANHFIMKIPVPDWIWIDLHSLYKLSVTSGQHKTKIVSQSAQAVKTHTPEDCYKQVLLLNLAEPTGLIQKDIPVILDFIESIAPLITFKSEVVVHQKAQCLIIPDEDRPPYFKVDIHKAKDPTIVYIDFTELYRFINQQDKSTRLDTKILNTVLGLNSQITKPPAELLEYLQQRWLGIDLQSSLLFSDRGDRYIAIGLPATYSLKNTTKSNTKKTLDAPAVSNIENKPPEVYKPPEENHTKAPETTQINEDNEEFLSQSASDRLLSTVFNRTGVLSVGSLVSFRKKDEPEAIRCLGIVNKMNFVNQADKITFGIQLLAESFYTVDCKQRIPLNKVKTKAVLQQGIFYTSTHTGAEKNYVITDYFMFEEDEVIDLIMRQEEFPAIMKHRKNIGVGYWQFECQRVVTSTHQPVFSGQPKKGYDFI